MTRDIWRKRFSRWLYRWGWALRYRLTGRLPPGELFGRAVEFLRTRDGRLQVNVIDVGRGGLLFAAILDATGWPNLVERIQKQPAGTTITYRGVTLQEYIAAMEVGEMKPEFSEDVVAAVWIVCGGQMQVAAVEAAHRLGLHAIVSDRNSDCVCAKIADEFVQVDIYDVPGHIAAADALREKFNIWGVFTEGADCEVTVAELARHLHLPGIDPATALRCKNKAEMRRAFDRAGVSPVWWRELKRGARLDDVTAREVRFPVMVKAIDNCGSRGTHRVDAPREFEPAIADAIANSTTGTALLEEYLEGPQQSVELLFGQDDKSTWCHHLNIVDRPFDGVMELGHVNPTRLSAAEQYELFTLAERAAAAVGVGLGAFKCDTIWTKGGPRILECTARLSGGFDCQLSTPRATGRDFITAAMRVAVGLPPDPDDLRRRRNQYCAVWAAFPRPGKVTHIDPRLSDDIDSLIGFPHGVTDTILRVKVGDVIAPYSHCATRPAFVAAIADSYDEAVSRAQAGAAALAERIVTE